jgi:hypothetical protein
MLSNILPCGIVRSDHCWYSTATALPFQLQKPYMKCMLAYSLFLNILGILTMTTAQHNTATLAYSVYKQQGGQATAGPIHSTST